MARLAQIACPNRRQGSTKVPRRAKTRNAFSKVDCVPSASIATSTPTPSVSRRISATTSIFVWSSTRSAPMRLAIARRTGSDSTAMMKPAPLSFAPAVAHKPIGPWAKIATTSPIFTSPLSAAEMPVDAMSASSTTCSSLKIVGNFCQVCLGVRNQKIFGLGPVDGIPKFPSSDWPAALRPLASQAVVTLSAGSNRPNQKRVHRSHSQ